MALYRVKYRQNNSGGVIWMTPEQWLAIEQHGWAVEWGDVAFCNSRFNILGEKGPKICSPDQECPGHQRAGSYQEILDDPSKKAHLGQPAWTARKTFSADSIEDAIRSAVVEWERATGQLASEDGCNCCGPPHRFTCDGSIYSGEKEICQLLFGEAPTRRQLLERKSK